VKRRRRLGSGRVAFLVAASMGLLTIVLYAALRFFGSAAGEAVQLSTSVVLVAVTAMYVTFTYQLLQASRDPSDALRVQRELTAAQEVSGRFLKLQRMVTAAGAPYPLERGKRPSPESLKPPPGLEEFVTDSQRLMLDLPTDVSGTLSKCLLLVGFGYARTAGILLGVIEEDRRSEAEHRDWSWDSFLTYMQHNHARYWTGEEFNRSLNGGWVADARAAVEEVHIALASHLRPELIAAIRAGPNPSVREDLRL
jgi:hypothetical protein